MALPQLATNAETHITVVQCHRCQSSIPVQVPPGNADFQFPCPSCGTENMVRDAPKKIHVRAAPGDKTGDTIRFLSPEGIKMEATIPPGVVAGSSFLVEYRLKQAAKDAALLHLSDHIVNAKDMEVAPEDCRECCICMEPYQVGDKQAFLPCFHRFHVDCARSSLAESMRCPMCNQDFHKAAADARKLITDQQASSKHPSCSCAVS